MSQKRIGTIILLFCWQHLLIITTTHNTMRHLLFLLTASLVAWLTPGCQNASQSTAEAPVSFPNIVLIMADDLGYGDLGGYGQETIQTPYLDRMATEGMRFTQHYAGNTVCAPSRCALMTGYHMGHAEIRGNTQADPYGQAPLSDTALTVAEVLQGAGYRTALIGKWGLGVEGSSGDPLRQGFDTYYGYLDQVLAHNYYPEYLLRNGEREMLANEVQYLDSTAWHRGLGSRSTKKVDYSHDLFTQEALKFIEQTDDQPFFLYLPYTIPHNNGEALPGETMEVPDAGSYATEDWPQETQNYAAMITRMDRDVGQLLDQLRASGLDSSTLVIFTSDNGPMPDEDFTNFFDSNGPLRGGKRDMYEGGIRVPFIARWPGTIQPNTQNDHISAFWDFLPTAAELAGAPVPTTDGISYLPALRGDAQPPHDYLYWEFPEKGYRVGLRRGQWKAVRNNMEEDPNGPIELYNLAQDPGEENNVADQHPEVAKELTRLMKEAHVPSEQFPMPGEPVATTMNQ